MYIAKDLAEVRKIINRFGNPIHIIKDEIVMIWDATVMDDIGECLVDMDINQKNLCNCYEDCTQDVFVGKQKNGLQNRNHG